MNDIRYFIKKPGKSRRSFALVGYRLEGRKKIYESLKPALRAELVRINSQPLTDEQKYLLIKAIVKREGPRERASLSRLNEELFDVFWKEVYEIRYLEDPESPRYGFLKALRAIEPLSIQSAGVAELQIQLKKSLKSNNEIRVATGYLNQILKYLKRDIKINKPKSETRPVDYLTFMEFEQVLLHLDGDMRDLAMVLFATGLRLSEAFALRAEDFRNGEICVTKQQPRDNKIKLPKAHKTGWSLVLPFGIDALMRWLTVPNKTKYRYMFYGRLIKACELAKVRPVGPHDLRHSHAIYLLEQGVGLMHIALQLRNHISVCQKHYTGFAHTAGTLDALRAALKRG